MKAQHLSLFIILLCSFLSLNAATHCEAPAPSTAHVESDGPTYTTLSWSRVSGAISYQVVVSELHTGTVIGIHQLADQTTHTVTGLTMGIAYKYEISASYCGRGPYGSSISIIWGGTVVDIILQLTCSRGESTVFHEAMPYGSTFDFLFAPNFNGCYRIRGETASSGSDVRFDFGIKRGDNGLVKIGNLISNPDNFFMDDDNNPNTSITAYPISGYTINSVNGTALSIMPLFEIDSEGDSGLSLTAKNDLDLMVSVCQHCDFRLADQTLPFQAQNDETNPSQGVQVYPNPVDKLLQLQTPEAGKVEIWDFAGRQWYSRKATDSKINAAVDVQAWPAGTYILRWYPSNQAPVVRYFMKQ